MDRGRRPWTPEEEETLLDLRRRRMTFRQIAGRLGRTEGAVANRHSELMTGKFVVGEERSRFDPWRPEEDAELCRAYLPGGPTLREVAERIGRSEGACKKRAQQLGQSASRPPKPRPGLRKCHGCGRPTPDYRCPACRKKWQIKHHVPLDNAAKNAMGDDWE